MPEVPQEDAERRAGTYNDAATAPSQPQDQPLREAISGPNKSQDNNPLFTPPSGDTSAEEGQTTHSKGKLRLPRPRYRSAPFVAEGAAQDDWALHHTEKSGPALTPALRRNRLHVRERKRHRRAIPNPGHTKGLFDGDTAGFIWLPSPLHKFIVVHTTPTIGNIFFLSRTCRESLKLKSLRNTGRWKQWASIVVCRSSTFPTGMFARGGTPWKRSNKLLPGHPMSPLSTVRASKS